MRAVCLPLALLSFVALPRGLGAQALPELLDEYHVRVFGAEQGLPHRWVGRVAQTPDRLLYAPTGEGVARFDGRVFRTLPAPGFRSRYIQQLHVDAGGRLWLQSIAQDFGYVAGGRVRNVTPELPRPYQNSLLSSTADGALWIGGVQGLTRVEPGDTTVVRHFTPAEGLPDESAVGVFTLPTGENIAVTRRRLARVLASPARDGGVRLEPFGPEYELPTLNPDRVHVDDVALWLALGDTLLRYADARFQRHAVGPRTAGIDLSTFRWADGRTYLLRGPVAAHVRLPGLTETLGAAPAVRVVLRARDGTIWLAARTDSDGKDLLIRGRAGRLQPVPLRSRREFDQINDLMEDHEGSLWIATDQGLLQLAPRRVHVLTHEHGLRDDFTTPVLQTRDGAAWVGTWGGGLHRFLAGRLTDVFGRATGLPSDRIRALHEAADGTLWVGTYEGYAAIRGGRVREASAAAAGGPSQESSRGPVRAFAQTADGRLWLAEPHRLLYRTADGGWHAHEPDLWRGKNLWSLHAARDGSLWVGGLRGLFRVDVDGVRDIGAQHGMPSPFVVSAYEEADGTLWFGTYRNGLLRWRAGRLTAVTTGEGLHANGIWRVLEDGRGGLWMSSDRGIFRVEHARLHAVADALERGVRPERRLAPVVFREPEGMLSRESNRASPAGWRLADGRLAFNSQEGLVVIEPERALEALPVPRAFVRTVMADGRPLPEQPRTPPRVPPGSKHLAFEFAALSYLAPSLLRYRYMLEGYDRDWVYAGSERRASYADLPPGRYTFRVQAANGRGAWDEHAAGYALTLQPFFWQTGAFQALAVVAVLGLLGLGYRYHVGRLIEVERMRLRIAADLHDDVGSSLSSIALLSEMLQEQAQGNGLPRQQLERIHQSAEETIGALRELIWLVNPEHGNLAELIRKMRRVTGDLLNGTAHAFEAPAAEPRPLGMPFMRNVLLIYKEALHNVAKHAGARHVRIRVVVDGPELVLRIRDDGRGFGPGDVHGGSGLANMKRRAEQLGGDLEIRSDQRGTSLFFTARMA